MKEVNKNEFPLKERWVCKWSIYPDCKEKHKTFSTFEKANRFVRELISESTDVSEAVHDIRSLGNYKYLDAIATFLKRYAEEPEFPKSIEDIPANFPDEYDDYATYPEAALSYAPFGIDFFAQDDFFHIKLGDFELNSSFVLLKPDANNYNDELKLSFISSEYYKKCLTRNIELTVSPRLSWGSSAHSIMVLRVLENSNTPLTRDAIASKIEESFKEQIERKAVGRMIALLKALGYEIQASKKGFQLKK